MSMTTEAGVTVPQENSGPEANILVERKPGGGASVADTIHRVARETGISPIRQFRNFISVYRNGINGREYYSQQVYLPQHDGEARKAFVGERGNFLLNLKLSPPGLTHMRGFFADKIALTAVLSHLGLPATQPQAALSQHRQFGRLKVLRNEAELLNFLQADARYPVFGKPLDLLQAIGSVGIRSVDPAADLVELANGRTARLSGLVKDIIRSYGDGFLFEDAIDQHPEVTARIGPAIGSLRVCTVVADEEPEVLYAVWKVPSPTGMSDNFWQAGTMLALPDQATGEVLKCRRGTGPDTEWIDGHPQSGQRLTGFRIPHFEAAKALAVSAHAIFPINGVLGWDIAIGANGPLIIEANENPAHQLYQFASGRGVRNPDFEPILQRVIARSARLLKTTTERNKQIAKSA